MEQRRINFKFAAYPAPSDRVTTPLPKEHVKATAKDLLISRAEIRGIGVPTSPSAGFESGV